MKSLEELQSTLKADNYDMDTDTQDIFIEESIEVLQAMDINLPQWTEYPTDFATLSEIRRGFHTLKGSGRLIGANNIGEVAWAVESLLNRVLDNNLAISQEIVEFVNEAKAVIPYLVNDFANQQLPSIDPAILILMAENLTMSRAATAGLIEDEVDIDTDTDTVDREAPPESLSVSAPLIVEPVIEKVSIEKTSIEKADIEKAQPLEEIDTLENIEKLEINIVNTSDNDARLENTKDSEQHLVSEDPVNKDLVSEDIENQQIIAEKNATARSKTDNSAYELPNTLLIDDYFDDYHDDSVDEPSKDDASINSNQSATIQYVTQSPSHDNIENKEEPLVQSNPPIPTHKTQKADYNEKEDTARSSVPPKHVNAERRSNSEHNTVTQSFILNITPLKKTIFVSIAVIIFILLAVQIF